MEFKSYSPKQIKKIARFLSNSKIKKPHKKKTAMIFGLIGKLGSGKTTFAQEFAKTLGIKKKITSPTFLIIKNYDLKNNSFEKFIHVDAYRIKNYKELDILNFKKLLKNKKTLSLLNGRIKLKEFFQKI